MKKHIIFLFLFGFIIPLTAQNLEQAKRYLYDLTSPQMHGRGYAYNGDSIAAEYIREQFINMKAKPLGENYYQTYSFSTFAMEGKIEVRTSDSTLSQYEDYRILPFSHSVKQQVNIITFSPKNLTKPEKLNSFILKNEELLKSSFVYIDQSKLTFKSTEEKSDYQKAVQKLSFQNPFSSLGILIGDNELPVWSFGHCDFQRDYAIIYVKSSLIGKKCRSLFINFDNQFIKHQTQNVCAYVLGTTYRDSTIVFSAHYDHLGSMGAEVYFPGAHDNASGVAAVLDLAQHFTNKPSEYSTVFLLFSGEEAGLRGSAYFADHPLIDLDKISLMINIDMLGGGDDGIMMVNSTEGKGKKLYEHMSKNNEEHQYVKAIKQRNNAANSDHYPFAAKGVPAIFIYTLGGAHGGYHNYTDTYENCGMDLYENLFRLILSGVE